ncbi:MAG: hypothetical protein AAFY65_08485 [Pseudomonadota bacterium]
MIPRATVAQALGLPADTEALPPEDLPLDRFMARYLAYLGTEDAGTQTPDAWTGAVMDHLIATDPDLALAALATGAEAPEADRLADPLADLNDAGHGDQIAVAADQAPALAALLIRAQTLLSDDDSQRP